MAVIWLVGAVACTAIAGLLQGHEAVWSFYLALLFALAALIGYVGAAIRSIGGPDRDREREPLARTRLALGIAVGVAGFVWGAGYGLNHQAWFGERVTAVVTDHERRCGGESGGCRDVFRLAETTSGDDLGWLSLCGGWAAEGEEVAVTVDRFGWVKPLTAECDERQDVSPWFTYVWLGGVGAVPVVRVGAAVVLWRRAALAGD